MTIVNIKKSINGTPCVDHLGIKYPSLTQMCNAYGKLVSNYKHRRELGYTVEEALTIENLRGYGSIIVDHAGIEHKGLYAMCKHYGVSVFLYKSRREKGVSMEESLTTKRYYGRKHTCKDHYGREYMSIPHMCDVYGIEKSLYYRRRAKKMTLQEILETPLPTKHPYLDHLDNHYDTLRDLCWAYGIEITCYQKRAHLGYSLQKILTKPVDCKDHCGNTYKHLEDMCEKYNRTLAEYYELRRQGASLSEILVGQGTEIKQNKTTQESEKN